MLKIQAIFAGLRNVHLLKCVTFAIIYLSISVDFKLKEWHVGFRAKYIYKVSCNTNTNHATKKNTKRRFPRTVPLVKKRFRRNQAIISGGGKKRNEKKNDKITPPLRFFHQMCEKSQIHLNWDSVKLTEKRGGGSERK